MVYKKQTKTSASEALLASLNAEYGSKKNPFLTKTLQERQTPVGLVDGPIIIWNVRLNYNAYVTLGGNRTLSITNLLLGDYGTLKIKQDGSGNRTITLPAGSKVGNTGAGAITLSTTPGAIDIITFYYDELGILNFTFTNDFT